MREGTRADDGLQLLRDMIEVIRQAVADDQKAASTVPDDTPPAPE